MSKTTNHVDPKREFEKTIREIAYRHQVWRVFSDFCEMTAIALSNVVHFDQQQEDRYTGNTLTMEMQSVRYTLAHKLGMWDYRFQDSAPKSAEVQEVVEKPQRADILLPSSSQYQLFEMKEAA